MNFQKSDIYRYLKVFVISIILLVKCSFLFAQKEFSDSAKTYEYWTKRGIIEVLYAYMDDYITTVTDSSLPKEKKKDCTNEINGLKAYKKQFISQGNELEFDELSSKFDELSAFLVGNNWSGAEKNVLQPLISNYKAKKTLNSDFFTEIKPAGNEKSTVIPGYSNKMINWNKTVSRILSDYNEDLKKLKPKRNEEEITSGTSNTIKPTVSGGRSNPPVLKSQNWEFVLLIGFLSFIIGMIITFFLIKSRIYYLLDDDKETYKNSVQLGLFSFLSMVSLLKKRKDDYKNKVRELLSTIEKLEKKSKPENDITTKTSIDNVDTEKLKVNTDDSAKSIEWDISKEVGNTSISYFSIPENDGRFIIEKGEQINDGSKYYKIEHRNNSDEGSLFYINSNQDKRAINRLDSYLKPVCDVDNIINAESASKIEVLKYGKVIKIADSWVIDTNHKVKIKLV